MRRGASAPRKPKSPRPMRETNWAGRPDFDRFDAPQMFYTTPFGQRVLFRLFGRPINRLVARVLARAYERRLIDSYQFHALAAQFDPSSG